MTTYLDLTNNPPQTPGQSVQTAPEAQIEPQIHAPVEEVESDWSLVTQELIDTLPRVWTRGLLYLLIAMTGVILPWSMLAKIDETGQARGKLEPKGNTIDLDTSVMGKVTAIHVKEGQKVQAGQILVTLDTELIKAELAQVQEKVQGQLNRVGQLEILKNQLMLAVQTQRSQNQAQELEKRSQIEQAKQHLESLKASYSLQRLEKEAQVTQAEQAIEAHQAALRLAQIRWQMEKERVPRYKMAYEEGVLSEDRYLEAVKAEKESEQSLFKAESEIAQAKSRLQEQQRGYQSISHNAASEIQQANLRLQEQQRSYETLRYSNQLAILKIEEQINNLESDLTTLKAEIAAGKGQIESLKVQLAQRVFHSPIDGTIFQLPSVEPGNVVQPGELVAQIAPEGTSLILKANMPVPESGLIQVGMPVKMKFDAYPFQDYGTVEGEVQWVSPTSKVMETPQGNTETFEVEVTLEQNYVKNAQEKLILTPGQTAAAEVIIRQRRVIDFVLDPFKKLQEGGLNL